MIDCFGERASRKSGPTAEVDRLLEEGGFAGGVAGGQHRPEPKRGAHIAEGNYQRGLEFWRILIEQRPNISLRHRCNTFIAKQHEPQTGAMPILGIGLARLPERLDRGVALAEPLATLAKRKPGR